MRSDRVLCFPAPPPGRTGPPAPPRVSIRRPDYVACTRDHLEHRDGPIRHSLRFGVESVAPSTRSSWLVGSAPGAATDCGRHGDPVDRRPPSWGPASHPVWLWCSEPGVSADDLDRLWQLFLRRFDLEHTFRFFKQTLGWTAPRLRRPAPADRWTWIVLVAYAQLRLARPLAEDLRRPWERPVPPTRLTPARVRRGFSRTARRCLFRPVHRNPVDPDPDAHPDRKHPPAPHHHVDSAETKARNPAGPPAQVTIKHNQAQRDGDMRSRPAVAVPIRRLSTYQTDPPATDVGRVHLGRPSRRSRGGAQIGSVASTSARPPIPRSSRRRRRSDASRVAATPREAQGPILADARASRRGALLDQLTIRLPPSWGIRSVRRPRARVPAASEPTRAQSRQEN